MLRVLQPRQDLPLGAELPHPLGVEQAAHHLDRHLLQELVVVALGEVDGAHPALAEHRDDAIRAEPLRPAARAEAVTSSTARLTTLGQARLGSLGVVGGQHPADQRGHLGVGGGAVHVGAALVVGQLEGRLEQLLRARPSARGSWRLPRAGYDSFGWRRR